MKYKKKIKKGKELRMKCEKINKLYENRSTEYSVVNKNIQSKKAKKKKQT